MGRPSWSVGDLILFCSFYVGMPLGFVVIPTLVAVWLWRHL